MRFLQAGASHWERYESASLVVYTEAMLVFVGMRADTDGQGEVVRCMAVGVKAVADCEMVPMGGICVEAGRETFRRRAWLRLCVEFDMVGGDYKERDVSVSWHGWANSIVSSSETIWAVDVRTLLLILPTSQDVNDQLSTTCCPCSYYTAKLGDYIPGQAGGQAEYVYRVLIHGKRCSSSRRNWLPG